MFLFRWFSALSFGLGSFRTLIRRLGGLALVLMGVHAAADVLDDLAYDLIDKLDLVVDISVARFLGWLSAAGGMTPDGAVAAIDQFSAWVDLAEKDWLALRLALVVELVLDVLLLDLAWGKRVFDGQSLADDLAQSVRQLRESLSAFDLERVLGPLSLFAFAIGGAVVVGLAIEQPLRAGIAAVSPDLLVGSNLAAGAALVVAAIFIWRFSADLVHGALVRAHERGEKARARVRQRREASPPKHPRVALVIDSLRGIGRGLWLCLVLGIATAGLLGGSDATQGVAALVARVGALP